MSISKGRKLEMDKSKIFIASSSRTLVLAEKLRHELDTEYSHAKLWNEESRTQVGATIIEWLEDAQKQYDFAVVLLSKDDVLTSRDHQTLKARDNCVFEAGLFMSAIGRKRCFLVNSVHGKDLPSDLAGIISIPFKEPSDLQIRSACEAAIIPVASQLKDIMQVAGPRSPKITITSPRDVLEGGQPRNGATIYSVEGTLTYLPSDHKIWVLNESDNEQLYPQDEVRWYPEQHKWRGSTFVWNNQPDIKIVAVAAPPTSSDLFKYYRTVLKDLGQAHKSLNDFRQREELPVQMPKFPHEVAIPRLPRECTVVDRAHPHRKSD
jgi:hypothetical protein